MIKVFIIGMEKTKNFQREKIVSGHLVIDWYDEWRIEA